MNHILYNGKIVTGDGMINAAVIIEGERISKIVPEDRMPEDMGQEFPGYRLTDLQGKAVFAGGIDAHVHFREPGMTQKADMHSESMAALKGGVTSFIDMPNTNPPTVSAKALSDKLNAAENRSYANYGFHIAATNGNIDEIRTIIAEGKEGITKSDFGGIKVFMGSSTGNMLVDDPKTLQEIFEIKEKEILVHCEDEKTIRENLRQAENEYGEDIPFSMHSSIRSRRACILSSLKALETAMQSGTRLHLLHVSTMEETEMLRAAKISNHNITGETSANYLWFTDRDYDTLGSLIKCNPSIKTENDRKAIINALKNRTIDTIGSDHAPHLLSEKQRKYMSSPSGIPSIQQSLQVLVSVALEEDIPLSVIASVFSEKAAEIFGIKDRGKIKEGYFADLAIVDTDAVQTIEDVAYKCGWCPYQGNALRGKITDVFINGRHVIENSVLTDNIPHGKKLVFNR